jgi:hypothetical protein
MFFSSCQEPKQILKYVLPVPGGKKEFCCEPCLTAYRKAQKAIKNTAPYSTPNPYSLPSANGGSAAARTASTANGNKPPSISEAAATSDTISPIKTSNMVAARKSDSVLAASSSGSSSAELSGPESQQHDQQQSPGNSKKNPQNPEPEVSSQSFARKATIRRMLRIRSQR